MTIEEGKSEVIKRISEMKEWVQATTKLSLKGLGCFPTKVLGLPYSCNPL